MYYNSSEKYAHASGRGTGVHAYIVEKDTFLRERGLYELTHKAAHGASRA